MTLPPQHPQRFSPPAPPGALLKRLFGIVRVRAIERDRDDAYLATIRECPCLRCGLDICGEASHLRLNSGAHGKHSGMGKKPPDKFALPLCGGCHREDNDALHRIGEREFWARLGINPFFAAERLYAAHGDLPRMRAVAFSIIGERVR